MKKLFAVCALFIILVSMIPYKNTFVGTIYYVKAAGGSGSGLDDANAWSLAHFNSVAGSMQPGDSINFNRGDVFNGGLDNLTGGTKLNPVKLAAYGSGALPKFTGLTTLSSWTNEGGNIWYATINMNPLRMVVLDGKPVGQGRYPNSGYNYITSHTDNSAITDASVSLIPFDPLGAEIVIRKDRYIHDRHPITSRSGTTINYTDINPDNFGYTGSVWPNDNNGYFIQNSKGTLDSVSEWYNDITNHRLYMYFSGNPNTHTIQASTTDVMFYLYTNNIKFKDLDFEGGNTYGCLSGYNRNVDFTNVRFTKCGGDGFYGINDTAITFNNLFTEDCLNGGINVEYGADSIFADNSNIRKSGIIAGMAKSGNGAGCGINISAAHSHVLHTKVTQSGYNGIGWNGYSEVAYNKVDSSCLNKDDGGALYTYTGLESLIHHDTISYCPGDYNGAHNNPNENWGKAAGIYIDNTRTARNAHVYDNIITGCAWAGIVSNNVSGNDFFRNVSGNSQSAFLMLNYDGTPRGMRFQDNILNATYPQNTFKIEEGGGGDGLLADDDFKLMGTFDTNTFNSIGNDSTISIFRNFGSKLTTRYTLRGWRALTGGNLEKQSLSNGKVSTSGGKWIKNASGKIIMRSK